MGVAGVSTISKGVGMDTSGNSFVTGRTSGNLDGEVLTGSPDAFVTKYDSAGVKQWTKLLGVAGFGAYAESAAADSSGNVFMAGYTDGDLDGNVLSFAGNEDFFVTKYDASGTKEWTRQLGVGVALKYTEAWGVATDAAGSCFLTGNTSGGLDGNTVTGNMDFFVTKYSSAGVKQ